MAKRDRRLDRRLRYLDAELRHGRQRLEYWTARVRELERERAGLGGEGEERAGEAGAGAGGGGLADLVKSLNPETLQQIGEAVKGVDLQPFVSALGGEGGAGALLSALSGGGVGGLLGAASGLNLADALEGISEVTSFFAKNPLKGKRWTLKDVPAVLSLLRSPNVRALIGSASVLLNLVRAGSKAALPAEAESGHPSGETPASSEPPTVRFTRTAGPPPVLEPWRGGGPGRWVWVEESGTS